MHITIFDLDQTLCRVNTSFHFGLYLLKKKVLSLSKLPLLMGCYLLHKCKLLSISTLHKQASRQLFLNRSTAELKEHVRVFLDEKLSTMLDPFILNIFNELHKKGHYTVLLSSSPDFLVEGIAKRLKFHEWAGTKYSSTDGFLNGKISYLMEGKSKASYVEQLIQKKEVTRDRITAYSDSALDLDFLMSAGHQVAVNPDKTLKKVAVLKGWKVIQT